MHTHNPRTARAAAVTGVLLLALTACSGGDDAEPAAATTETGTTASAEPSATAGEESTEVPMADVMFAAQMIPHHQAGIELTQMALDKAVTPGVREVAQREQASQQEQLPRLEEIAAAGGMAPQPPEPPLEEFNQQEMAELMALEGEAFDRKWLDVFSSHHMAAIMMSDVALASEDDGTAQTLQQEIHDGQLTAVEEMNALRAQLG